MTDLLTTLAPATRNLHKQHQWSKRLCQLNLSSPLTLVSPELALHNKPRQPPTQLKTLRKKHR